MISTQIVRLIRLNRTNLCRSSSSFSSSPYRHWSVPKRFSSNDSTSGRPPKPQDMASALDLEIFEELLAGKPFGSQYKMNDALRLYQEIKEWPEFPKNEFLKDPSVRKMFIQKTVSYIVETLEPQLRDLKEKEKPVVYDLVDDGEGGFIETSIDRINPTEGKAGRNRFYALNSVEIEQREKQKSRGAERELQVEQRREEFSGSLEPEYFDFDESKAEKEAEASRSRWRMLSELDDLSVTPAIPENEKAVKFKFDSKTRVYTSYPYYLTKDTITQYFPEGISGDPFDFSNKLLRTRNKEELSPVEKKINLSSDLKSGFVFREALHPLLTGLDEARKAGFTKMHSQPIVLDGLGGTGKSYMLNQIVLWARRNNWIVLFLPNGFEWLIRGVLRPSRVAMGCYDQTGVSQDLLASFKKVHGEQLQAVRAKGSFKVGRIDTTKNTSINQNPTLGQIMDYCLEHPQLAAEALGIIRKELNTMTEYPVLIAVDDYNAFCTPFSQHPDVRNPDKYHMNLPMNQLSLARLFLNPLSHGLVNGTMALSLTSRHPSQDFHRQIPKTEAKFFDVSKLSFNDFYGFVRLINGCERITGINSMQALHYLYHVNDGNLNRLNFNLRLS